MLEQESGAMMASPSGTKFVIIFSALLLSACNQNTGPGPEIHDIKYAGLTAQGEPGDSEAKTWPCIQDQYTGLIWEVKSAEPGLRFSGNTYSWYNPEESHDKGLDYRGTQDGGQCTGSDCDTWAFVLAVNEAGYCGFNDWRVPSRDELASISDPRKVNSPPTVNLRYFPGTQARGYWSGNDYHFRWDTAWLWDYKFGHDRVELKHSAKHVRLVRGEALQLKRVKD